MLSSIKEAIGSMPKPDRPVDLDVFGQEFLKNALRESRTATFNRMCPKEYLGTDWSRPCFDQNRPQIAKVTGWSADRRGLILTGPTGRGKTRSAWELTRRLMCEEGRDIVYWHAMDWFSTLQSHVKYGRDDAKGWVDAVAAHWLVFIDDYGQEAVTKSKEDWAESWFFRFLDIRIERGLPMLITSNLGAKEMADRVEGVRSDPLVRRVVELCEPVKFQ